MSKMENKLCEEVINELYPIRGSKEKANALYELDLAIGEIEYAIIWEEEEKVK